MTPFLAAGRLAPVLAGLPEPALAGAETEAAVLVCLHDDDLLLVRRELRDGDRWSGHVGLPGGRYDEGDAGLLHTALRETREEVGFDPLAHGRVLGCAGTLEAHRQVQGDVRIAIFVAEILERPQLSLSHEIAAAYWVPARALVLGTAVVPERPERVPAYLPELEDGVLVVWGITYRILELLRELQEPARVRA